MTCREFVDFLMAYLGAELPADVRARFVEHLADCPGCIAYLETYEKAVRLGKTVFADDDEALPPDVPEELVQAILTARAAEKSG